jgi:hypothetical protein
LFAYAHASGCAIAGGAFYNPATVQFPPSFVGKYFFADLCGGWIHLFDPATGSVLDFASGISSPVDLKVGADGSLYYLARGSGSLFRVQFTEPALISEPNTDSAVALDSVTLVRDPFALVNPFNFSSDQRTRLMLFGMNLDLLPGENSSAVTARLEDASQNVFPLTVEFVGKVPGFNWLTEIVVRLPDNTPVNQTLNVSVTLRGKTSNKVKVRIK